MPAQLPHGCTFPFLFRHYSTFNICHKVTNDFLKEVILFLKISIPFLFLATASFHLLCIQPLLRVFLAHYFHSCLFKLFLELFVLLGSNHASYWNHQCHQKANLDECTLCISWVYAQCLITSWTPVDIANLCFSITVLWLHWTCMVHFHILKPKL